MFTITTTDNVAPLAAAQQQQVELFPKEVGADYGWRLAQGFAHGASVLKHYLALDALFLLLGHDYVASIETVVVESREEGF